jgi:hypothetical protein
MENPDKPGSLWLSGDTNPGLVLVGIEYSHRSLLKKRKGEVWGWPSATEKATSIISAINYRNGNG